jgi:ribosome biogenesis GTPase A
MLFQYSLKRYFAAVTKIQKRIRLGRPGTSLKMGLLGMANIGKSSTFNILSNLNVPA